MKKLLSLLSVLTISGAAIPTTIAASPYQKETINLENNNINFKKNNLKNLNRNKRWLNGNNEVELFSGFFLNTKGDIYVSFTPEFWEEIVYLFKNNDKKNFINKFKDKMYTGVWKDWRLDSEDEMKKIGETIHDNFWTIANKFIDSSRTKRIKIKMHNDNREGINLFGINFFININIITEDIHNYQNKYLNNLEKDFPIWNSNKTIINLGIIEDNTDYEIKNALSKKYPNFQLSNVLIVDKKDFSNLCNCFKAKLYVNNNELYSFGNLRPTLSYITKNKINEISNIIINDSKVKQWIEHLQDWSNDIKEEIKTSVPQKTQYEKNEWKIEELDKNVQRLKSNFETLKNQIKNWDNKIKNLEESTNNCESHGYVVSGITGVLALFPIPVIQQIATVVSATSGAIAALCGLGI